MIDPQVAILALGAWSLGVLVGLGGAARHAFFWYVRVARRDAPRAPPRRLPDEGAARPLPLRRPPVLRTNGGPFLTTGRATARGICLICGQRWGTCDDTCNG